MTPTVGQALAVLRQANGLTASEAAERWWTCRLGPIRLTLPNFK
jgi:hypothetical protein